MHYCVYVVIPGDTPKEKGDIEQAVEEVLRPYGDEGEGNWDWYQIGGRWTGLLDGYDPNADPQYLKPCDVCGGTGKREPLGDNDFSWRGGCNGCDGKGTRVVWPTQFGFRAGDVAPVREVLEKVSADTSKLPYAVVTSECGWVPRKIYLPWAWDLPVRDARVECPNWPECVKKILGLGGAIEGLVVVVDCHN